MKLYHSLKSVKRPSSGSIVAIGVFDGLHKGHRRIINTLLKRSKITGRKSLILTFYPHPASVLYSKNPAPLLISLKHRLRLLEELGIDIAVVIEFTEKFSRMKPERFMRGVLQKRLGMKEMLVGDDFVFGNNAAGNVEFLKSLSEKYGFTLTKIRLLKSERRIISSTYIRSLIIRGNLARASRLLGRPVSILGTVKKGRKKGRLLGYPTANIDPHHEAIPPSGVYAVYVYYRKKKYKGILNIGVRPTFYPVRYPPEPTIEVHIFNFNKDIYGRDIEIIFVKRLRPEKRFKDKEGLINKIKLDERKARNALKEI
ncbi:MAG: bifunctional riboflavin kinase/FAD synthetase [Candidatus Omnitrophica bacterium]|nr:bifunctional riboflavin kinase/FAD synthetase [Candidatus Omnitrophota bacterium]